ncbi:MAG: four helix bundle protein [Pyrinomonadaceae bacterium]
MVSGQWLVVGEKVAVQSYRQLIAWQKAMELVALVDGLTDKFPREELFGLTSQVRRAVVSVPSNIAEGQGRDSTKDFIRYLSIAYGSLMETETQILIAEMREYVSSDNYRNVLEKSADVGSLVNGLSRSLVKKLDACD